MDEIDDDEGVFQDPFGIWKSVQEARFPDSAEICREGLFAMHRELHKVHQAAIAWKQPCDGLAFQQHKDVGRAPWYCNRIGCPTCWYRRRCYLFGELSKTSAKFYYTKVIESRWDRPIDPHMLKSFKEDWTGMTLLGYMIACDVEDGCDWEEGRKTPMPVYRRVGVFASDKRIRPRKARACSDPCKFCVDFSNDVKTFATCEIRYEELATPSEVIQEWVILDPYPFKVAETDEYGEFLTEINARFKRTGRVCVDQMQKYVKKIQSKTETLPPGITAS